MNTVRRSKKNALACSAAWEPLRCSVSILPYFDAREDWNFGDLDVLVGDRPGWRRDCWRQ